MAGAPPALAGMTIGLLGGSFDPPHEGHVHITRRALAALGLDRIWWVVSPGNPLKPRGPAALARRMAAARAAMVHPRVDITDIEARLGTRHTADTLAKLCALHPGVRFVWLMGADNLAQFHRWRDWRGIMALVPVAVLPRPGAQLRAGLAPAARAFAAARLPAHRARALVHQAPPAWVILGGSMRAASSTAIRRQGAWPG